MLEQFYNWLIQLILSCTTFLKILLRSKLFAKQYKAADQAKCIIMGNAPSLASTIENNLTLLQKTPTLCVNYFPNSKYYTTVKPSYLVIVGPELWLPDMPERTIKNRTQLYNNLVEKTDWKLTIFFPYEAKKATWMIEKLAENQQISLQFFNKTPVEGLSSVNRFFYGKGWGMPRPHNVLIPSLMLTLNAGFKEIFIVGADHSWLEELTVNEKNEALLHQKHFYDEDSSKPNYMYQLGRRPRRLYEILEKFMLTFKAYFEIETYAQSIGIKIWNATPKSFIDAFERKPLPQ